MKLTNLSKLPAKQLRALTRALKQHSRDVAKGIVPSGGWCKSHERYDCGCEESFRKDMENDDRIDHLLPPAKRLPPRHVRMKLFRAAK